MKKFEKLDERLRFIMKDRNLTRQEVADIAEVSLVTVHKWLTNGNMKEDTAKLFAGRMLCDWLWLKHGVNRIPEVMEKTLSEVCSNSLVLNLHTYDEWVVEQMGNSERQRYARYSDDLAIDIDTRDICREEYWEINEWSRWTNEALLNANPDNPAQLDVSDYLIDVYGEKIKGATNANMTLIWTDKQGITHGFITMS